MPKLFAVRWPIAVSAVRWPIAISVLLLLAGTIGFATTLSSRPTSSPATRDDYAGERQQLLFFKAALGRIDDELRHRGGAATPSLRGEREAVLRRMREVASRVPAERLPPEVAALLPPAPAPAPAAVEATARPRERSLPKVEVRELATGLGTKQADIDFSSLALDRPPPLPVYLDRPPRRAEHRDGEPAEKTAEKTADRPARERPVKEKERAAAEKPAKEQPSTDRAAKERAPAERATERPPVTVERTAIAVQSEARPPAR